MDKESDREIEKQVYKYLSWIFKSICAATAYTAATGSAANKTWIFKKW